MMIVVTIILIQQMAKRLGCLWKCEAKDRAAVEARDEIAEAERKCEPEDRAAVEAEDEIASGSRNRLL